MAPRIKRRRTPAARANTGPSIEAWNPIEQSLCLFRGRSVLRGHEVFGSEPQRERRGPPPLALSADVEAEILARLPARSVGRFRCACKAWYARCCDRAFVAWHHRIAMSRQRDYPDSFVFLYYDLDDRGPTHHLVCSEGVYEVPIGPGGLDASLSCDLVGSSNGLLCLSEGPGTHPAYVCNPLIRKLLTLPPPATPSQSLVYSGFGFDPKRCEFKAVSVWDVVDHYSCDVCAMGPSGVPSPWRTTAHLPVFIEPFADSTQAVVEGNIHWLAVPKDLRIGVLAFDLGSEQFRVFLIPDDCFPVHVAELRGHLSVLSGTAQRNSAVEVWVMKDYGNEDSWIKAFSIANRLYNNQDVFFSMEGSYLCSWKESEILIGNGTDLISYDLRSKMITDFPMRWLHDESFILTVMPHANSLLWLEEEGVGGNDVRSD